MDVDQQLAWERRWKPWAIASGLVGAFLPVFSLLVGAVIGTQSGKGPEARLTFLDEHSAALILGQSMLAIGFLGLAGLLYYLGSATAAREPRLPRLALPIPLIGGLLLALPIVVQRVLISQRAADFVAGPDRSRKAAEAALDPSATAIFEIFAFSGQLLLALALVVVCLNAVRSGLLGRADGYIGIALGFVTALNPLALPLVPSFWQLAVVAVLTGRAPGGTPPAWRTGRAEPWPTQQELMEARQRAEASEAPRGPAPSPEPEAEFERQPQPAAGAPAAPGPSRKRKRKRR